MTARSMSLAALTALAALAAPRAIDPNNTTAWTSDPAAAMTLIQPQIAGRSGSSARVGKTDQVRTDPKFEDARGPNIRRAALHPTAPVPGQRRLSPAEVEALTADYEGGGRVEELARIDGVHRTTVSRAGRVRPAVG
jgi:hypothetical protein